MSAPQILETMRKELDQLLDALIRDFQHLRFGPIKPRQLFPVLLYGTILEFFDGCVHLLESRSHASLPVVLRSLRPIQPTGHWYCPSEQTGPTSKIMKHDNIQ